MANSSLSLMALEEPVPNKNEIKNQLHHMLASKRFKAARNQADFLELVVMRALAGKKNPEWIIGRRLFGWKFKKDESTDVRVTASHLREKLVLYSENEGQEDPVSILLPKPPEDKSIRLSEGEAYTPIFAYNRNSEIAREYRLGLHFLSPKRPFELSNAMEQFKKVWQMKPQHVGAVIGMIEASCLLAFMGWGASAS